MARFEDNFRDGKLAAFEEMRAFVRRRATSDPTSVVSDIMGRLKQRCGLDSFVSPKSFAGVDAEDGFGVGDLIPGTSDPEVQNEEGGEPIPGEGGGGDPMPGANDPLPGGGDPAPGGEPL